MNGATLKQKLLSMDISLAEVARKLNVSQQSLNQTLNAVDIKTGFIEQLSILYERPISYFFGENLQINDNSHRDNHSSFFGNTEHNVGIDAAISSERRISEEKITSLKTRIEDKDALLASKDEIIAAQKDEIENLRKTLNYLLQQK